MDSIPQKSATAPKRRIPRPFLGVDLNFCRNAQCSQFGVQPDWRDGRGNNFSSATNNLRRGEIKGSGDEKNFTCGWCGQASVIKNNRSVVEEYRRLRRLQWHDGGRKSCGREECPSHGRSLDVRPELYRKAGQTSAGHQRYACKRCCSTFAVGHPARNHRRQSKNGQILKLLVHGTSLSKISEIVDLAPRDVYRKLDFIYERVRDFTVRREADLRDADRDRYGRRFATDSQTLTLNWPNRKKRASVAVQPLCTAHANSGHIVLGHLQFDPAGDMEQIEIDMASNGDLTVDRCWRRHGRFWTASEFKAYLDRITAKVVIDPEIAPDVDLGLQLPHKGALVRHDIQQYAHALMLRRMVSKPDSRFYFVQDGDAGLSKAFLAAFAPQVKAGRVDVATVGFDKYQVNDVREALYAQGRKQLRTDLGLTAHQLDCLPSAVLNDELDREIVKRLIGHKIGKPFAWPYHTKSEPTRVVDLKTDRSQLTTERCARLMRLATLRSVDSYFHKIRSNVRPASRPVSTPSGNGRTWDGYYLYNPMMLIKT